jgi:hypothetical protein
MAHLIEREGVTYCVEEDGTEWEYAPAQSTLTLDEVKVSKIDELVTSRDNAIYSSFQSSALGEPKTYNYSKSAADDFGRETSLLALDTTIASVDWYVIEDGFVSHTREQFVQVIRDGALHERTQKMKFFNLEAQVKAAVTAEEVNAIIW